MSITEFLDKQHINTEINLRLGGANVPNISTSGFFFVFFRVITNMANPHIKPANQSSVFFITEEKYIHFPIKFLRSIPHISTS